ncbi:uncharacterized protein LOC132737562 [Ruditapes philippinarum]|uniref:uncharacterized protein LOC132737562 n=1 Tax=Ruditapes philippinarum TaxID=129788 RepID=UPI00295A8ACD|nr:uncharacterized protein LOC132737562 [Ruditapes philippinarum]
MGYKEEAELDAVNQRNTKEYLPAIVLVSVVLATGLCLNTYASLFYGRKSRKSAFQIFILSLSINFLITNLILVHDIVELFYYVDYKSVAACKLFYVLKHWFVGNSLFFMVAIGFDRYRSVCFPFSKALTLRTAWCVILGLSVFSFCISVRLFVTTDIAVVNITTNQNYSIQGSTCTFSESESLQTVRVVFHFVDIFIHSIIILSFVFFHTFIIRKLINTRKKVHKYSSKTHKKGVFRIEPGEHSEITSDISTKCDDISDEESPDKADKDNIHNETANGQFDKIPKNNMCSNKKQEYTKPKVIENINNTCSVTVVREGKGRSKFIGSRKKRVKSKARLERRITVMATVKTVSSIACFVPFYVSMMVVSPKLNGDGLLLGVGIILARRSFMLNSAINPIIMIIFNDAFRQYLKEMCRKLFSKCRKLF